MFSDADFLPCNSFSFCLASIYKAFSTLPQNILLPDQACLWKILRTVKIGTLTLGFLAECEGIGEQGENANKLSGIQVHYGKMVFNISD